MSKTNATLYEQVRQKLLARGFPKLAETPEVILAVQEVVMEIVQDMKEQEDGEKEK